MEGDNPPKSVRHPTRMVMYAELMGNHKKQRIKSHCDNKIDVEMGTSKMKAKPYLRPGIENNAEQYRDIIKQYLSGG